jgi:hypothetical protein
MSTNRQKGMPLCSNNSPISWSSKKQTCVALSTMEAEYIACSASVQEAVWLRRFLLRLGILTHASAPC